MSTTDTITPPAADTVAAPAKTVRRKKSTQPVDALVRTPSVELRLAAATSKLRGYAAAHRAGLFPALFATDLPVAEVEALITRVTNQLAQVKSKEELNKSTNRLKKQNASTREAEIRKAAEQKITAARSAYAAAVAEQKKIRDSAIAAAEGEAASALAEVKDVRATIAADATAEVDLRKTLDELHTELGATLRRIDGICLASFAEAGSEPLIRAIKEGNVEVVEGWAIKVN